MAKRGHQIREKEEMWIDGLAVEGVGWLSLIKVGEETDFCLGITVNLELGPCTRVNSPAVTRIQTAPTPIACHENLIVPSGHFM